MSKRLMAPQGSPRQRTDFSHIPILGRSRHTIGISIPQTIGRIRWSVTPNGKSGQPRLGIELSSASIPMIGGVYFGTADGPTSPPLGWRTQFSHIPILGRPWHAIADRCDNSSNNRMDPVASNAYVKKLANSV